MSKRKPFNDFAGYVASRINALTGVSNVIYIASEQGVEADHKYITVCDAHHTMVSAPSIPQARLSMKDATQFCEGCRTLRGIAYTFQIGDRVRVPASLMYKGTTGTISGRVYTFPTGSWVKVDVDQTEHAITFTISDVTPLKEEE